MKNHTKGILIDSGKVKEALATPALQGKRLLEPLKSIWMETGSPVNILEDKEVINDAEVHVNEADLWFVLEGEVTFIHGGEMVDSWFGKNEDGSENKSEIKAKDIKGGEEVTLGVGDWFWIPAGVPHLHKTDGTCRMAIIKVPKCE